MNPLFFALLVFYGTGLWMIFMCIVGLVEIIRNRKEG